jgi:hypothetical protein
MAKSSSSDFFSSLQWRNVRDRAAKALSDLESGGREAGGTAEKIGRQAIKQLRSAADTIEKRLDLGGAGTRSRAAKKGAAKRKRTAAKRRTTTKKGATTRKSSGRKTTARKSS